jgi:hypothetical protein
MTKWSISLTFITHVPVKKTRGEGNLLTATNKLKLIKGNTYVPGRKIMGANVRY